MLELGSETFVAGIKPNTEKQLKIQLIKEYLHSLKYLSKRNIYLIQFIGQDRGQGLNNCHHGQTPVESNNNLMATVDQFNRRNALSQTLVKPSKNYSVGKH